ncbi:MAG: hypothetical protein Q9Q40_05965 [Acidobacteriota bacterium]|nr:hypothetical protein [Acidobacteriota bacterium]
MSEVTTVSRPIPPARIDEVVQALSAMLGEQVESAATELRSRLASLDVECQVPAPREQTPRELPRYAASIAAATGQVDALRALLAGAESLGARAAVIVVDPAAGRVWNSVGFPEGEALAGRQVDLQQSAIAAALEGERVLCGEDSGFPPPTLGEQTPVEALLVPIRVQDRVVGLFHAERPDRDTDWDPAGLEMLATTTGLVVERLALAKALARSTGQAVETTGPVPSAVSAPAAPGASAPVEPAPAAAPEAEVSGGVVEPTGDGESPEVEDARRFARLLMEEICLYNADRVEAGRQSCDLLERLGDEISQARQMYAQRISPDLADKDAYFRQAVVDVLGAGDPKTLGAEQGQPG